MRVERTLGLCIVIGGLTAPLAFAQDYGDERDADSAIRDDAVITASIAGFAGGDWHLLNSEGRAAVPISEAANPQFVTIGAIEVETTGQTDVVEAAWWEVILPAGHFIQLVMRTQNGHDFVPFGAKRGGKTVQAYTYEMGGDGDGVDFRWWVDHVLWEELTVSYSYDGGQNVFADPTISDPNGGGPWDGTDDLHLSLIPPGEGVNWMQASFKIEAVPAPGTALALLAPGAAVLRRRRR